MTQKMNTDACGIGFVANIKGLKSHSIVINGLEDARKLRAKMP